MLLITITVTITVFAFTVLLATAFRPAQDMAVRLRALDGPITGVRTGDEELDESFLQRVISPLADSMGSGLVRLTPASLRRAVDEKLTTSGGFGGMSTDGFLLLCGFLALALAAALGALALLRGVVLGKVILLVLLGLAVGSVVPVILLNRKIRNRKTDIQKALPDVLDLLTVSIEAGLGFDGALVKLAEKMKGPLVDEFSRTLQEMRIGVTRREALHALGKRCDVADLSLFTSAMVQADQLGVSVGNVLRVQSAAMRQKRRQRAQERAMKAPVKMLLPLVGFIFPAIFVVLVGPAAIRIVTMMMNR